MEPIKNKNKNEEEGRRRDARSEVEEEREERRDEVEDINILSSSSEMSLSEVDSEEVAATRTLRSHSQKSPAAKVALRFPTELRKRRAGKEEGTVDPAVATKVSSAVRGRAKRPGAYQFLTAAKAYLAGGEESGAESSDLPSRPARRLPPETEEAGEPSTTSQRAATVEALAAKALLNVTKIQGELKKSGSIKGTALGQLNKATQGVIQAVEGLRAITPEEEQRRLRAENARLARELELMRGELRAFKEAYAESQKRPATSAREAQPEPSLRDAMEEMKRELLESVGGMLNARLQGLEGRLPPEPVTRPPLRADRRQPPPPRPKAQSGAAREVARPGQDPQAQRGKARPPAPPPPPPGQDADGPPRAAATAEIPVPWSKVVGRKKRKKAKGKTQAGPPPTAPAQPGKAQRPPPPKAVKIVAPKTAAITVTLKKGATTTSAEGQVSEATYAEVLTKARTSIRLSDFGLESVKVRTSMTGSKLMEVGGAAPEETADRLAAELVRVIGAWADVTRPSKLVDLRVSGLDETVTCKEVAAKVAATGNCPPGAVKVGRIRKSYWGGGATIVRCPAAAAKAAVQTGKVAIGWSMATISAVEARPMRCYRCMMLGHTRALCPTEAENGRLCFRCGQEGHKAATCEAPANCAVCAKAGCPHKHIMGGAKCAPPKVKGKTPPKPPPPTARVPPTDDEESMQVS
ncbi:PREDICTED: serine/arginine repetitive matrix protein 1-like [Papilio xuthus]|uniref:Serine/arginine repetitive matrix protein 1-like n=1 Tax=Papilio xuthus TaxID=66420 RepID=A0AAJ7E8S7_PAPXU|nr:PREDICTED: serine/arginine repetitive matrix protein 1-like [Papilio xuthus]